MHTSSKSQYYIGLMSGTSLDGVDAVLVESTRDKPLKLIETLSYPFPSPIKEKLDKIVAPDWEGSLANIGTLHQQLGKLFADSSNQLLKKANFDNSQITAIGSHGQTLWHQPSGKHPFSLQLGDASLIAELTNITTVADFRSRDIAAGGQGAPLVPAFHLKALSSKTKSRVILNIGGIANITILPAISSKKKVSGFDTGPGNTLLDAWIKKHKQKNYDHSGIWASSGKIIPTVLAQLYLDPFFSAPLPKSTGKELFNIKWLQNCVNNTLHQYKPDDIQATLAELTVKSIVECIPDNTDELYICGGGAHNQLLFKRLQKLLPEIKIDTTLALGIDPDWMEAIAFAWLAQQTIEKKPGNIPSVTGARGARILGAIYPSHD